MTPSNRSAEALAYLQQELGPRAPQQVERAGAFDEAILAGEGAVTIFAFELAPEGGAKLCGAGYDPRHYVVVGDTTPNYFPAFGLDADDAYSLHLGTRFMLEMQISRAEAADEPPALREEMRSFAQGCNPLARLAALELAGLFRCEDQLYSVYRLNLDGVDVYGVGGDLPPGFYQLAQHPPQVALRLHLGKLLRTEAAEAARQSWRNSDRPSKPGTAPRP